MYGQYLCSGLAVVMAVNVADVWALPRLACLRWHLLGMCQDAGLGGVKPGRRERPTSNSPHTRYGADKGGGVAGAEPPHKGGPTRPDRTTAVVSGQWLVVSRGLQEMVRGGVK